MEKLRALRKEWTEDVERVLKLKAKAEDSLDQLTEELGSLTDRACEISELVECKLDEVDEDDLQFDHLALVLQKWEEVGPQDLVLEWDMGDDLRFEELKKMPWPEGT